MKQLRLHEARSRLLSPSQDVAGINDVHELRCLMKFVQ
jgi:hypothetical protein